MKRSKWIRIILPALVAIALLIAFQLINQKTKASTGIGERKTVVLPEGSSLIMNAGSQVKYNEKTFAEKRILDFKGEAKFRVRKSDKELEGFLIETQQGLVRVINARFNLYAREDGFRAECYKGNLEVRKDGKIMSIGIGEKVKWSKEKQDFIKEKHYDGNPDWFRRESSYVDTPLELVVREIERQFGIKITLDVDPMPYYTGSFPHDNLQATMDNIADPFDLRYEQEGEKMRVWKE